MKGAIFYEKIGSEFCENSGAEACNRAVISSQEIKPKISQIFEGAR